MAEIDWTNHPKLKNIDEKKLKLIKLITEQAKKQNPDEMVSFFMAVNAKANSMGISFNDDETDLILEVFKTKMSPADIKKIDTIRNISKMLTSKNDT